MKNLVIVESPAKARTIEKFLGDGYTVKASMGHIRDLPGKRFGIDIEQDFEPEYEIAPDKKKVVSELKKLAKKAEKVWIATDEDREGEAIGWHLCAALGLDANAVSRIVFHEITKKALEHAIKNPRGIDANLVNAQQSRRVLDRIVGFQVSPILWQKIRQGLSAGRVQSVAVKLIVEREREIRAFVPEERWHVFADLVHPERIIRVELSKISGKNAKIGTIEELQKIIANIDWSIEGIEPKKDKQANTLYESPFQTDFSLQSIVERPSKRSPGIPFTTSLLQQEASRKLGFSVSQTMSVAQNLYQNGHITYMRTDSVNLSTDIIEQCRTYIAREYGDIYVPEKPKRYKTKQANAQEAHEAIRPVSVEKTPAKSELSGNEFRLYRLIWERTVACQMRDAEIMTTTYTFTPNAWKESEWTAKGEVITFPGFMRLYIEGTDDDQTDEEGAILPKMTEGEIIASKSLTARQSFTRPPARYTEAMLVKKLESEGIGRPSTYVPTIATIVERNYVEKRDKRLHPTDIAFLVNDFLEEFFSRMMDYGFTANIETELDRIATGETEWIRMLSDFYADFVKHLEKATADKTKIVEKVGRECPSCGGELVYKYSRGGKFIGCANYPECKHTERVPDPERDAYLEKLREQYE